MNKLRCSTCQNSAECLHTFFWTHGIGGNCATQCSMGIFFDLPAIPVHTYPWSKGLLIMPDYKGIQKTIGGGVTHETQTSQDRSEEHTSELQSHSDLVCRLLLEKKKKKH